LYTCTCTGPAASPGNGPFKLVAFVGNGTVNVVLPVSCVARQQQALARDRERRRRARQIDRVRRDSP